MRQLLRIILALIVLGMALVLVLALLSARPSFLTDRVRDVLAQELATASQRQVQVGQVSGNLLTGVRVDNLAIADEQGFAHGSVLAAERVTIKYDLPAVLRGRIKAPASIKQIDLDRAYVLVDRGATGKLNLEKLFKPKVPQLVPPEEKFQPLITLRNSVVDIVAQGVGGQTIRTRLTPVDGSVKINPVGPMQIALTARSGDGAFGSLSLRASSDTDEHYFIIEGRLTDAPLRRWGSLLPRSAKVGVAGGSASADFQVWQVPSAGATVGPILATLAPGQKTPKLKREFGYLAQVGLQGVTVRLPAASGGDVRLNSARAEVTPQGVQILDLDGSWQSFPVRASGWIYDLSHPRADLHLRATGVDLAAVRRRLPASLTKGLNGDLAGNGDVTADAIGPLQNLNATVAVSLPRGALVTTPQTGEVTLGSVTLHAFLWDSAKPAIAAHFTGTGATLETTFVLGAPAPPAKPGVKPGKPPDHLSLYQVGAVQADVLLAGGQPLVRGTVGGVRGAYEGAAFTGLSADLTLAGDTVRLPRVEVDALGGHVRAEALITLPRGPKEKLRAIANGTADHLNLALLPKSLFGQGKPAPTGLLTAEFGATWSDGRGSVVASLDLGAPSYGDYVADRVQTLARASFGPGGDWTPRPAPRRGGYPGGPPVGVRQRQSRRAGGPARRPGGRRPRRAADQGRQAHRSRLRPTPLHGRSRPSGPHRRVARLPGPLPDLPGERAAAQLPRATS